MIGKKFTALLLAAIALTAMLTSCIGHLYPVALTVEGEEIGPGMYLMQQYNAFYEAAELVEDSGADPRKQKIEGVSGTKWIREHAVENCRRIVAVQKLSEQYGVQLSENSELSLASNDYYWSWISEYYTENGISYDTWRRDVELSLLATDLFDALYTGEGENAWSREQLEEAVAGQLIPIRYYYISLKDSEDNVPEDLYDFEVALDEVLEKLNSGKATLEDTLVEDLPGLYELLGAEYDEDSLPTISLSHIDKDTEIDEFYTEEWLTALQRMAVGQYGVHYTNSDSVLVYERVLPFNNDDAEYENLSAGLTRQLRSEEFNAYLKSVYDNYSLSIPFGMQWYYRPSKITE